MVSIYSQTAYNFFIRKPQFNNELKIYKIELDAMNIELAK